jgi:hypothetical protein
MKYPIVTLLVLFMAVGCDFDVVNPPWWVKNLPPLEELAGHCGGVCSGPVSLQFDESVHELIDSGQCRILRTCYEFGQPERFCAQTEFEKSSWATSSAATMDVPCDGSGIMTVECYSGLIDEPDEMLGPHLSASLPPIDGGTDCTFDIAALRLVLSSSSMLTQNVETLATTSTSEPRWGAAVKRQSNGWIVIAGGAQPQERCSNWAAPDCVDRISANAEWYVPHEGEFHSLPTRDSGLMQHPRAFAASELLPDGRIAIFGGLSAAYQSSSTVDIFDPKTGTFSIGPVMQYERAYHTATLISHDDAGTILLVGGYGTGAATWETWNPETGSVESGELHEARWHHTATLITQHSPQEGKRDYVFIAGGESAIAVSSTVEILDLAVGKVDPEPLSYCTNLGQELAGTSTMHAAALPAGRFYLYFLGGFTDKQHHHSHSNICVWNTADEEWTFEPGNFPLASAGAPDQEPVLERRGAMTATALAGNYVAVIGGLGYFQSSVFPAATTLQIWEYTDTDGEITVDTGPTGFSMVVPRWDHRAVAIDDKTLLVIGGLMGTPEYPLPALQGELFRSP